MCREGQESDICLEFSLVKCLQAEQIISLSELVVLFLARILRCAVPGGLQSRRTHVDLCFLLFFFAFGWIVV